MGTRADFYVGRGETAEWLGSIAWDGYPEGIPEDIRKAEDEDSYREAVDSFFDGREDVTKPDMGWPWPWEDSRTTDFAYAFDSGVVYGSCFGHAWFEAAKPPPDDDEGEEEEDPGKVAVFPNMLSIQKVNLGKRSGLLIVTSKE